MNQDLQEPPVKELVKKWWNPWFFLLGFLILPNVLFLAPLIYNSGVDEDLYNREFEYVDADEYVKIVLPLDTPEKDAASGLNVIDVNEIVSLMKTDIRTNESGKFHTKRYENNIYSITFRGRDGDRLLKDLGDVINSLPEIPGGYVEVTYGAKDARKPLVIQLDKN